MVVHVSAVLLTENAFEDFQRLQREHSWPFLDLGEPFYSFLVSFADIQCIFQ